MNFRLSPFIVFWLLPLVFLFSQPVHAVAVTIDGDTATIVVDSTSDKRDAVAGDSFCADEDGKCGLRAATEELNALEKGTNTINFNIPLTDSGHKCYTDNSGAGVSTGSIANGDDDAINTCDGATIDPDYPYTWFRISIGFSLDRFITVPITINGYSQTGASEADGEDPAIIKIECNGNDQEYNGFNVEGGGTTIKGLAINQYFDGIVLYTEGNNTITGNYLGTDISGTLELGNTVFGLAINDSGEAGASSNNVIGGITPALRNIISGNDSGGIDITNSTATNNTVIGNYIGLDVTGENAIANGVAGISIENGANNNTIGGNTAAERNIISGSSQAGIVIDIGAEDGAVVAHTNTITGNYIGTDKDGDTAVSNTLSNIVITSSSSDNTISNNVIAASSDAASGDGIRIDGTSATGNTITGNYIGTNADSDTGLGNARYGIYIFGGASDNTIGGTTEATRNIISANGNSGIFITGTNTTGNVVSGNYIGTNVAGTNAMANAAQGILISAEASDNTIGGTATGALNVISGNTNNGIRIQEASTTGNTIAGNYIGLDSTGGTALPNSHGGILIVNAASDNVIGGTTASARNFISGNTLNGIVIQDGNTTGNTVVGNYIGLNVDGNTDRGNGEEGILIQNLATTNYIGVTSGGTVAGNVISGNGAEGIQISDAGTDSHVVKGNYIGLNAAGTGAVANDSHGIEIVSSDSNTIGGSTAGEGNVLAGNSTNSVHGISIGGASGSNVIKGNYIGTNAAGTTAMGWTNGNGIDLQISSEGTVIGASNSESTCLGACNIIAGNGNGISTMMTAGNLTIQGNYIGTDINGTDDLENTYNGISIGTNGTAISDITIGGSTQALGNIIANSDDATNGQNGVNVGVDANISNVTISHNIVYNNKSGISVTANNSGITATATVTYNTVYDSDVNGIACNNNNGGTCTMTAQNNIVSVPNDTSGTNGLVSGNGGTITSDFNDVYNHAGNDFDNVEEGSDDLTLNPFFTNPDAGTRNFSLQSFSRNIGTASDGSSDRGVIDYSGSRVISFNSSNFSTLQAAVTYAASEDTVNVDASTSYAENITINKTMTLDGAGTTSVINPASGVGITLSSASDATVSDFTVTTAGNGVSMSGGSGNTLSGLTITSSFGRGINISSASSDNTISDSTITAYRYGISIFYSPRNTLSGLTVTSSESDGIYFSFSSNNTITSSTITDSLNGINISGGTGNTISSNTIQSNESAADLGTYTVSPFSLTYGNNIYWQSIDEDEIVFAVHFMDELSDDFISVDEDDTDLSDDSDFDGSEDLNLCLVTATTNEGDTYRFIFVALDSVIPDSSTCTTWSTTYLDPSSESEWEGHAIAFFEGAFTNATPDEEGGAYTWQGGTGLTLGYNVVHTSPAFSYNLEDYTVDLSDQCGGEAVSDHAGNWACLDEETEYSIVSDSTSVKAFLASLDLGGGPVYGTFYYHQDQGTTYKCGGDAGADEVSLESTYAFASFNCEYEADQGNDYEGFTVFSESSGTFSLQPDNYPDGVTVYDTGSTHAMTVTLSDPTITYEPGAYYSGVILTNSGSAASPTVLSSNTIGTGSAANGHGLTVAGTSVITSTDDSITNNSGYNLNYTSSGTSTFSNTDFEYKTYGIGAATERTNITAGIVNVYYKLRGLVQIAGEAVESATVTFLDSDGETQLESSTTFTTSATGYSSYLASALLAYSLTATDSVGVKVGELTYTASATSTGYAGSGSSALDEPDDSITVTMTVTDADDPVISSQSPASAATNVTPDSNITFRLTDSGSGIDLDTLSMTVNSVAATPTATVVSAPNTYDYSYNPSSDFETGTVTVAITVSDTNSNELSTSWSFTVDATAPVLSSPNPENGATGVAAGTDIEFTVTDSGVGFDPDTLTMTINSEAATPTNYSSVAYEPTLIAAVFDPVPSSETSYLFYYNPASDLSTGTVTVGVTISDTNSNELDTSYSFTVGTPSTVPPTQRGGSDPPDGDDDEDEDDDDDLEEPDIDLEEILPEELEEELSPDLIILPEPQYFTASLPPGTTYRTGSNLIYTKEIEVPSDVIGHWSQPYVEFLSRVVAPIETDADSSDSEGSADEITSTVIPESSVLSRPVLEDFLGKFGPDLEITRLQITKLSLLINGYGIPDTLPEVETKFSDVPKNDEALARIVYRAVEAGFIQGYPDGTFKPDRTVNRAEALKILFEGANVTEIILNPVLSMLDNFGLTSNPFVDLPLTAWHSKYVLFAYVEGIVEGYIADHTFRPGRNVSRAEAVKIAVLVMQHVTE